jgi:hypothetical protein
MFYYKILNKNQIILLLSHLARFSCLQNSRKVKAYRIFCSCFLLSDIEVDLLSTVNLLSSRPVQHFNVGGIRINVVLRRRWTDRHYPSPSA